MSPTRSFGQPPNSNASAGMIPRETRPEMLLIVSSLNPLTCSVQSNFLGRSCKAGAAGCFGVRSNLRDASGGADISG